MGWLANLASDTLGTGGSNLENKAGEQISKLITFLVSRCGMCVA
jgi:hypothetical protein